MQLNSEETLDSATITKKDACEPALKRPRIETPSPLPTFKVLYCYCLLQFNFSFFHYATLFKLYHNFTLDFNQLDMYGQVRKEKLGDRVTALQQLVSPFGKVKILGYVSFTSSFFNFQRGYDYDRIETFTFLEHIER